MEDTTHDQHHNEQQQEETPASEVSLSEDLEGRKDVGRCGGMCVDLTASDTRWAQWLTISLVVGAFSTAKTSSASSSSSSSSASGAPSASGGIDAQGSWSEWIEEKKKEYGSPNDWVDSNPTAKQYQQSANEFFKGIGQWGHEKALAWFPTYYNYEEPTRPAHAQHHQQQREEEASRTDMA
jgi:hypothetical protein